MANTAFLALKQTGLQMVNEPDDNTTSLTRMGTFINQSYQEVVAYMGRRVLEDTTTVSTVADQEYVALSSMTPAVNTTSTVDEFSRVYQTTTDNALERWSIQQYRQKVPDVSTAEGTPLAYARWRDRLYLFPRPDAVITLYADIWVVPIALSGDADTMVASLTHKYDEWILAGAVYRWFQFIDPDDPTRSTYFKNIYDELTKRFSSDLKREPDRRPVNKSHNDVIGLDNFLNFQTPVGQ